MWPHGAGGDGGADAGRDRARPGAGQNGEIRADWVVESGGGSPGRHQRYWAGISATRRPSSATEEWNDLTEKTELTDRSSARRAPMRNGRPPSFWEHPRDANSTRPEGVSIILVRCGFAAYAQLRTIRQNPFFPSNRSILLSLISACRASPTPGTAPRIETQALT